jgi:hypothetical protein
VTSHYIEFDFKQAYSPPPLGLPDPFQRQITTPRYKGNKMKDARKLVNHIRYIDYYAIKYLLFQAKQI